MAVFIMQNSLETHTKFHNDFERYFYKVSCFDRDCGVIKDEGSFNTFAMQSRGRLLKDARSVLFLFQVVDLVTTTAPRP